MTATGTPDERKGCGAEATRVAFRGSTRRAFFCDDCEYKGSGRVMPYATDVLGQEKKPGVYTGPARRCGDETGS